MLRWCCRSGCSSGAISKAATGHGPHGGRRRGFHLRHRGGLAGGEDVRAGRRRSAVPSGAHMLPSCSIPVTEPRGSPMRLAWPWPCSRGPACRRDPGENSRVEPHAAPLHQPTPCGHCRAVCCARTDRRRARAVRRAGRPAVGALWTALLAPLVGLAIAVPLHYVYGMVTVTHLGPVYTSLALVIAGFLVARKSVSKAPAG